MVYEVRRTPSSRADLDLIFDHLVTIYLGFDDDIEQAVEKAANRLRQVQDDLADFCHHPHKGTRDPGLGFDIRHVTKDRTIVYFRIDEAEKVVHVLALFFSGQDHQRHMIERLTGTKSTDS